MKKVEKYEKTFSKDAKKGLEDGIEKLTEQYCKKVPMKACRVWGPCLLPHLRLATVHRLTRV